MAVQFNNPFLDLLSNTSSKKTDGRSNSNSPLNRRDDFSPLDSPYYAIQEQMRRELQPSQPKTNNVQNLSTLLQNAQSNLRKISQYIGNLKDLASRAADQMQTDDARGFFQTDFYGTLGKIDDSANNMSWNGMIVSEGNSRYRINQVNVQSVDSSNSKIQNTGSINKLEKPTDMTDKIPGAISTREITFSGNLNANEPIITAIDDLTTYGSSIKVGKGTYSVLTLTDGSTMTVTDGRFTVGHSVPQSTNIQVYDSQGMAHNIPISLEKTAANTWVASLSSLTTAGTSPALDGSIHTSYAPVYSYIKEEDGTYTRVSFIDNEDTLVSSFTVNFNTSGQPAGILTSKIRLEYNFDAYPQNSEDEPRMFIQRPGGLYTYVDNNGNTYVTSNSIKPAGYLSSIQKGLSQFYIGDNPTFENAINGATVTTPTFNFSGLTQYVGQNTANVSSDGMSADARQNLNSSPSQNEFPSTQNNLPFDGHLKPMDFRPNNNNFPPHNNNIYPSIRPVNDNVTNQQPIINIYFLNVNTKNLGTSNLISPQGRFLNPFDQQRYDSYFGNNTSQNDFMDIIKGASNRRLNSIDILSQRNASIALRVIEGALSQIQSELSNVNSYIQRFIGNNINNHNTNTNNIIMDNRIMRDNFI
ncbi:MAG: hypothetical protein IJ728_03355 [Selenomonadaceae bacterium]|nr:hypothetical protein [Selenomonadaceae bacterium]